MKTVFKGLVLAAAMSFAGASQAALITSGGGTIDVGDADTFLGQTGSLSPCGPGGSPAAEDCWAESVIPGPDTLSFLDSPGDVTYFATNVANTYAFMLTGNPEYFIIKNATDWALYRNVSNTSWGVFSTVGLPSSINLGGNGGTISHVTTFNGTTSVPEPTTLALLGMGLLGMGVARRLKKKN